MKAEARQIAIIIIDILIEVGDFEIEIENDQRSCVAWDINTSKQPQDGNRVMI